MLHRSLALTASLAFATVSSAQVAPGTESLVPFAGVAAGSGFAVAGTGTIAQPSVISLDVPAGATVKQVLALWAGQSNSFDGDDEILLNGHPANGTRVGGPVEFFRAAGETFYTQTYRADVTSLNLISAGTNSVTVAGLNFDAIFAANKGVALIAVYDDGSAADLQLRNGSDNAFDGFSGDRQTTAPQTFEFDSSSQARQASLELIVAAVLDGAESRVALQIDDQPVTFVDNVFASADGLEFDTAALTVDIPAGATKLTVQVLSQDTGALDGPLASVTWIGSTFGLSKATATCYKHLDAKFWATHTDLWGPTGLKPTDKVGDVFGLVSQVNRRRCGQRFWNRFFGVNCEMTLAQALARNGGRGRRGTSQNLLRNGIAALLNAKHPGVAYRLNASRVTRIVKCGLSSRRFWVQNYYSRVLSCYNWRTEICVK